MKKKPPRTVCNLRLEYLSDPHSPYRVPWQVNLRRALKCLLRVFGWKNLACTVEHGQAEEQAPAPPSPFPVVVT